MYADENPSPLVQLLIESEGNWRRKVVLACDTDLDEMDHLALRNCGACVGSILRFGLPNRYLVHGDPEALKFARKLVKRLGGKALVLPEGGAALFHAGMTMGTALLTPMLERTAECFRIAGIRDAHAMQLASAIFEKTARAYAHSGKQSWAWHLRPPDAGKLRDEVAALRQATSYSEEFSRELKAIGIALPEPDVQ